MKLLKRITEIADKSADRFAAAVDAIIAPAELPQHTAAPPNPAMIEVVPDPNQEKRAAPRNPVQLPATVAVGLAAVPDAVEVRNLSNSGLCFVAPFRMGVGEVVELAVTLPADAANEHPRPVRYQARIVHARDLGGQFLHGASIRRCIAVPAAA